MTTWRTQLMQSPLSQYPRRHTIAIQRPPKTVLPHESGFHPKGNGVMKLGPQLRALRDFYYKTAKKLSDGQDFVHAPGLILNPAFFTLEHLKTHLNNPLLMPGWFQLFWQGATFAVTALGGRISFASSPQTPRRWAPFLPHPPRRWNRPWNQQSAALLRARYSATVRG